MNCTSTYTVDRGTNERLKCNQPQGHVQKHTARAYGHIWYWDTSEADKEDTDGRVRIR